MKKTHCDFWLFRPDVTFHQLLLPIKIVNILLFCGIALSAYSITPGKYFVDFQQQIKVSGTVIDAASKEAMPGVNIQVKGTNVGIITDVEGKYSLSVSDPNATLLFSFIGCVTQEIPLTGRTTVDVALVSEALSLGEVVVIGYGTASRKDFTGSVSKVKMEDSPVSLLPN